MKRFTDQTGAEVILPAFPPRRIISMVPSQTELLADLGLDDQVVGVTKFCIQPDGWFREKTRIGGTKNPNLERIATLQPDLILGNKEENRKEDIEVLRDQFPVWLSEIYSLQDATEMILQVGALSGRPEEAEEIAQKVDQGFLGLEKSRKNPLRVAYFIWNRPRMAAASNTFINHMIGRLGWQNVFDHLERYPEVTDYMIEEAYPELILLSSEPYPYKEKHFPEFQELCPSARVLIVEGDMFSWYGSRLIKAADYLARLNKEISSL